MKNESEIIIYQNPDGAIRLDVRLEDETVWLTQAHLCELFQKSKATISEHIKHVFEEGELREEAVVRNFRTTAADGKSYDVRYYNLDVIISVGYRVKSQQGTQFRIWATQRLKEYEQYKGQQRQLEHEASLQELEQDLKMMKPENGK